MKMTKKTKNIDIFILLCKHCLC